MAIIPMKSLLEAGVHFGHQTKRWNPRMAPYIYTARNGVYIIDLQKTLKQTQEAYNLTKKIVSEGGSVLFVGTKKQIQATIKQEAERCGMYYINSRWLGGTLTNFTTIKKRIARLIELEKMEEDGSFDLLPKKEVILLKKEKDKLELNLSGIKSMEKLPSIIFLVDSNKENICAKEARKLSIPTIGLIDTNCDPTAIDCVIPGNDDAVRAVSLVTAKIADAVLEAKNGEAEAVEDAAIVPTENEEEVETMEELVAKEGIDKIEKKPRQNRIREYKEKSETAQTARVAEADQKNQTND